MACEGIWLQGHWFEFSGIGGEKWDNKHSICCSCLVRWHLRSIISLISVPGEKIEKLHPFVQEKHAWDWQRTDVAQWSQF